MAEEPTRLDPDRSGDQTEHHQAVIRRLEGELAEARAHGASLLHALQEREAGFEHSAAGRYWSQLSTADFMNSSFAFAALAVLSAFPFLAVTSTVIGGDLRSAIVARMGLDAQAKHDVDGLIASGNQAVATLT